MTYGIQEDQSIIFPTANELFDDLAADFAAIGGEDPSIDSPEGQLIGSLSEMFSKVWEVTRAAYYSKFYQYCLEKQLDDAAALRGVSRLLGQKTKVLGVTVTNDTETPYTMPAGTQFKQLLTNRIFQSLNDVIIPAEGSAVCDLEALENGAFLVDPNTITQIVNLVSGLSSVNNSETCIVKVGRLKETNVELRRRIDLTKITSKGGIVAAIAARVRQEVAGVTYTTYRENRNPITDLNGLPPRTYEIIVNGGLNKDIAEKIDEAAAAGINTHGQITETITDSEGNIFDIKFSRITDTNIYLIVNLIVNSSYESENDLIIKGLLSNILFEQAEAVINWKLAAALTIISNIENLEILQGLTPSPTTTNKIIISNNSIARILTENIIINKTVI